VTKSSAWTGPDGPHLDIQTERTQDIGVPHSNRATAAHHRTHEPSPSPEVITIACDAT
jgi:hypothetical protein